MDPIQLEIVYADGTTKTVSALAVDLMRFEAHFDMSVAGLATPKLTHLFFLAYSVEKRTKATELDFEAWVESIQIVREGDAKK
ncbi:MAG: hypothetical protein EBR52_08780 [Microbacteriaceae bacterium]|nr:hypothetical protein [Microbacteriaceae bacterium]